ncbi:BTB/POZ domain-containing protein [Acrasis kona]|uniref:BTB/POZ domain-containing protein n=1 Tax=Acrasis kona TaxID=1008807 RepID=A0AAW2ZL67_9EUKA
MHQELITINVGGKTFNTMRSTITNIDEHMLSSLISDRFNKTKTDTFNIDRDPTHFRYILNYLRDSKVNLPSDIHTLDEILTEAQYYQIQGLIAEVQIILNQKRVEQSRENDYLVIRKDQSLLNFEGPASVHEALSKLFRQDKLRLSTIFKCVNNKEYGSWKLFYGSNAFTTWEVLPSIFKVLGDKCNMKLSNSTCSNGLEIYVFINKGCN